MARMRWTVDYVLKESYTIAWSSVEIAKISQWPSGAGGATPLTSLKTTGEVGLQCDALPGDCIAREGNRSCIMQLKRRLPLKHKPI